MDDAERQDPDLAEIALFSGKRRSVRYRVALDIECIGRDGLRYTARTVDISRGGMLAEITDPRFDRDEGSGTLVPFTAGVLFRFPEGMQVVFGDGAICAHAVVVRLSSCPGAPGGMRVGCRFDPALTVLDCGLLGIDPDDDETQAA